MLLLAALSIQNALHRDELDLAVFDPSQSLGTKNQEACFILGIGGGTMMLFLIIGALAGVLLGLRFKVLILIPFILIIACAIVATATARMQLPSPYWQLRC